MSTRVGIEVRVIGNGLVGEDRGRSVVLAMPTALPDGETGIPLEEWPLHGHALLDSAAAVLARAKGTSDWEQLVIWGRGQHAPSVPHQARNLWQRVMARTDEEWAALAKAWVQQRSPSAQPAALPLPTALAGLAVPLERGREVLEALSSPGSPLRSRGPTRPPVEALSAIGRPWRGEVDPVAVLAAAAPGDLSDAARCVLFGPPPPYDEAGCVDPVYQEALDPDALAADALGLGGRDLLGVFDRTHALHHAFVTLAQSAGSSASAGEWVSSHLERRLGDLLASASLLRLFGLARDVLHNLPTRPSPSGLYELGGVRWGGAGAVPRVTAVKLVRATAGAVGGFQPVPRAEWEGGDPAEERDGLLRLVGKPDASHTLITIEPALAAAGDYLRASTGATRPEPLTGGLALVRLSAPKADWPEATQVGVECAEELRLADRLDIGVVLESDDAPGSRKYPTQWRGAMHRLRSWGVERQGDRWVSEGPDGWIDNAIAQLSHDGLPAYEREAGSATKVTVKHEPVTGQPTPCFEDPRVAIWTGEPGAGSYTPPWWERGRPAPEWRTQVGILRGDVSIAVAQHVTAPTAAGLRIPPLRFGWQYRIGMRRVFLGGAVVAADRAARLYEDAAGRFCIPPPDAPGFRFLRHEAVHAPVVLLAPDVPDRRPDLPETDLQSTQRAVMLSWPMGRPPRGRAIVEATGRVLLAPAVPLAFAALHEAFDAQAEGVSSYVAVGRPDVEGRNQVGWLAAKPPVDGLRTLDLSRPPGGADAAARLVPLRAHERVPNRAVPYYPDPAARLLMLRLRHPERSDVWFGEPVAIPLRPEDMAGVSGGWPDALPVHLLVEAWRPGRPALSAGERPSVRFAVTPRGVPNKRQLYQTANIALRPGRWAKLMAWLAPGPEDIAAWFEVCEAVRRLGEAEGTARGAAAGAQACERGLDALLGRCISGEQGTARIGTLLHERLAREPLPQIAKVRDMDVLHATPHAVEPPMLDDAAPLAVGRRKNVRPAALLNFLASAGPTTDWPATASEDEGDEAVFGGAFTLDTWSASGVVLEADLVRPGDFPLDPPAPAASPGLVAPDPPRVEFDVDQHGMVSFQEDRRRRVVVLQIEGLPLPDSLDVQSTRFTLEELQMHWAAHEEERRRTAESLPGAWPPLDAAYAGLQVKRQSPASGGTARLLHLRLRAIPRHAALFQRPPGARSFDAAEVPPEDLVFPATAWRTVWLPATSRPAPPDVKHLIPTFALQRSASRTGPSPAWAVTRRASLRLVVRRPGFSSGEGERWGVLLWPPAALGSDEALPAEILQQLVEEDIGAAGRFVSVWGRDPIRGWDGKLTGGSILLERRHFAGWDEAQWHPRVAVPIPTGSGPAAADPVSFAGMLSVAPRFHMLDNEWFVDLHLDCDGVPDAFVRLGVVRYQPHARPDRLAGGAPPFSIRASAPTVVWAQLPPERRLEARLTRAPGRLDKSLLVVSLSGPGSTPPEGASPLLPRTGVRFTVVEARGSEEVVVRGGAGARPLVAETGASVVHADWPMQHAVVGRDVVWNAAFELHANATRAAQLAVVAEEFDCLPDAEADSKATAGFVRAGTRFFARLDLC